MRNKAIIAAAMMLGSTAAVAQMTPQSTPGTMQQPAPGQTMPDTTTPGQPMPGQTMPGQTVPGSTVDDGMNNPSSTTEPTVPDSTQEPADMNDTTPPQG